MDTVFAYDIFKYILLNKNFWFETKFRWNIPIASNWQHAITWTDGGIIYWSISAALSLDEMNSLYAGTDICMRICVVCGS